MKAQDVPGDLGELCGLGVVLDERLATLKEQTTGMFLAEALLKVRDRRGQCVAFVPNRVQREFERRRGRRNIVLKARQMGISTWVAGRFFLKTITKPGTLTVEVAHTQEAAEDLFRMVHRFWEYLPEGLRQGALRTSRSSARQMIFPALDSEYRVESAGDTNAGRGITIQNLHCSEVARWPGNAGETLAGLRAAMPPDGEIVLESTPKGASGCFFNEWRRAGETGTVRHFFPWWWESAYVTEAVAEHTLTAEEVAVRERNGLSLEQIGFRRKLRADFDILAKQEFAEDAEECFLASGACVFDADAIAGRIRDAADAISTRLGGALQIWYPPVPGRSYIVAADPAGGGAEGDYSAVQVVELETGLQCAELRAKLDTLELAREATALAKEYNQALLAVERNNHGSGVLAYLGSVCRYERLYMQGGQHGWLTTSVSRPAALARIGSALVEEPEIFQSRRLLEECCSFVRHANGKTGARAGEHDDCVMAMAIAMGVRAELLEGGESRSFASLRMTK
ncbi:MAG TPA: hypothetical protein VM554_10425 [Acidisarcina sp.]|nr:hypothetical protein [Acidisarcina sp.]